MYIALATYIFITKVMIYMQKSLTRTLAQNPCCELVGRILNLDCDYWVQIRLQHNKVLAIASVVE